MSLELTRFLMQVPTARRLLDLILDDLRSGRSVLALLPEGAESSLLRSEIWNGLGQWQLQIHDVLISQLDAQTPAGALGRILDVAWGNSSAPRTVENLLNQADLPEILFLDGFDELSEKDRVQWLNLVVQWAQVCQGWHSTADGGSETPPALCLLTHAGQVTCQIPQTNVFLSIRHWRGIPTTLEMRLLCRLASEQDTGPLSRWKEHTIPAIAGSDIGLADFLWSKEYRDNAQLADLLRAYGKSRGWVQRELEEWPLHSHPRNSSLWQEDSVLPNALYKIWARGMVHWTPEYGMERHSAVLALLDHKETLDHRLWRGQAGFLLAEIDEIRLVLCTHLNRSYGLNWPYKWQEPDTVMECQEVRETPFACQWGHLEYLLQKCPNIQVEQRWLPLVRQSRELRNAVAHYRPITLRDYEKFCTAVEKARAAGLNIGL